MKTVIMSIVSTLLFSAASYAGTLDCSMWNQYPSMCNNSSLGQCYYTSRVTCVKTDPNDDYPIDCSFYNNDRNMCANGTLGKCQPVKTSRCVPNE